MLEYGKGNPKYRMERIRIRLVCIWIKSWIAIHNFYQFKHPPFHISGTKALKDAGISYDKIEQATVGYCFGE